MLNSAFFPHFFYVDNSFLSALGPKLDFHQLGPLGRVGVFTCLSPSHAIFLCGRIGAERALSVDWCDLDLDLE